MTSAGTAFYDRQVALLAGPDIHKLAESQYHPVAEYSPLGFR